jgi:hypothetical protein
MDPSAIFIIAIIAVIVIRLIAGGIDTDRVKEYIENNGGTLISKTWEPFGKGWFGEKNDRIYKVIYLDKDKNRHEAYVKTSSFSGVYFTEDIITEYGNMNARNAEDNEADTAGMEDLKAENDRLKKEIEALKRQNGE